jgi:hypothetical protein
MKKALKIENPFHPERKTDIVTKRNLSALAFHCLMDKGKKA